MPDRNVGKEIRMMTKQQRSILLYQIRKLHRQPLPLHPMFRQVIGSPRGSRCRGSLKCQTQRAVLAARPRRCPHPHGLPPWATPTSPLAAVQYVHLNNPTHPPPPCIHPSSITPILNLRTLPQILRSVRHPRQSPSRMVQGQLCRPINARNDVDSILQMPQGV